MEQKQPLQPNPAPTDLVYSIQQMLLTLSRHDPDILRVNLNGAYDQQTVDSVESFQRREDLPVTGEIDEATFSALLAAYIAVREETASSNALYPFERQLTGGEVRYGDRFDLVTILQCMLDCIAAADDALSEQPITGIYDDVTQANVRRFQQMNGLPENGTVDRVTWNRMADMYNTTLGSQT